MARFCTECGAAMDEDKKFCTECGSPMKEAENPAPPPAQKTTPSAAPLPQQPAYRPQQSFQQPAAPAAAQPMYQPAPQQMDPKGTKFEPISTGGYIGIMLLMCIPVIGLILTIVWACGGCRKVNKRSLARASLIMMVAALLLSLVIGFAAKSLIASFLERAGISTENGIWNGITSSQNDTQEPSDTMSDFGAKTGGDSDAAEASELDELGQLAAVLEALEGLSGEAAGSDSINDLVDNVNEVNREAEQYSDGWPQTLPAYPDGTASSVASYRTEISGTSKQTMLEYIETLKSKGFEYQDFYDFGFTEEDMASFDGWWGTDGTLYLSISYLDGVVTVDHTYELPDISSYFE